MKVFAAGLLTETNSFVNLPTSLETFRAGLLPPGKVPIDKPIVGAELMFAAKRRAAAGEFALVEGSCFRASPAGLTSREAYETARDQILGELRAALPVDAVLLGLHGGMIAHGYPDTEGDLLTRVRKLAGPACAIGVEFDPHCLVTEQRLAASDLIVLYKEYPHTDIVEQADRLIDVVSRIVRDGVRPVASLYDCRQIDSYPTTAPRMRAFIDRIRGIEADDPAVLSISAVHGFVYGDSPELSTRVLVYTDHAKARGDALATQLGEELVAMRGSTAPELLSIDRAIDVGLAEAVRPVVIADPTDNAGGGAPSDNTDVLVRLLERGVRNVAFGPVWDPVTVQICIDAGLGAVLPLRIGGKVAPTSGKAVDCIAEVIGIQRGAWQRFGSSRVECGDAVGIRIVDDGSLPGEGIEVAMSSLRTQAFSLEAFTQAGIDPLVKQLVFLKSVNHFMAHFGPVAGRVLHVDGGGPLRRDYASMQYRHVRRPLWPLDGHAPPGLIH